jgi:hypothetical protein
MHDTMLRPMRKIKRSYRMSCGNPATIFLRYFMLSFFVFSLISSFLAPTQITRKKRSRTDSKISHE